MGTNEWLKNLKIGDKVIVEGTGTNQYKSVSVVTRFTENFIIVKVNGFETKYKKNNGFSTGQSYYGTMLREATPEKTEALLLKIKQRKIQKYVTEQVNWELVPKNVIEHLYDVLDPFIKPDEKEFSA